MICVLEILFCRFLIRYIRLAGSGISGKRVGFRSVLSPWTSRGGQICLCQVFDLEDTGIMSRDKFKVQIVQMVGRGSLTERGQWCSIHAGF